MIVNGVDLEQFGFLVRGRELPAVGERSTVREPHGGMGSVYMGGQVPADYLTIRGWWRVANHAAAITARDNVLKAVLGGLRTLQFPDLPDREYQGILQRDGSGAQFWDPVYIAEGGDVTLKFLLPNPSARARVQTVNEVVIANYANGSAPYPVRVDVYPYGAILTRIRGLLSINGGAARVLWDWQEPNGLTQASWSIDGEAGTVLINEATNARARMVGAWEYPWIHPSQGVHTLNVETTSNGVIRVIQFFRVRWW